MAMLIQPGLDNPPESHLTVVTQPPFRQRSEIASEKLTLPLNHASNNRRSCVLTSSIDPTTLCYVVQSKVVNF
jgi:hypothetical protein